MGSLFRGFCNGSIKLFQRPITSENDRMELQKDLDALVDWADKWQLKFDAGKCKTLHLGIKNKKN